MLNHHLPRHHLWREKVSPLQSQNQRQVVLRTRSLKQRRSPGSVLLDPQRRSRRSRRRQLTLNSTLSSHRWIKLRSPRRSRQRLERLHNWELSSTEVTADQPRFLDFLRGILLQQEHIWTTRRIGQECISRRSRIGSELVKISLNSVVLWALSNFLITLTSALVGQSTVRIKIFERCGCRIAYCEPHFSRSSPRDACHECLGAQSLRHSTRMEQFRPWYSIQGLIQDIIFLWRHLPWGRWWASSFYAAWALVRPPETRYKAGVGCEGRVDVPPIRAPGPRFVSWHDGISEPLKSSFVLVQHCFFTLSKRLSYPTLPVILPDVQFMPCTFGEV